MPEPIRQGAIRVLAAGFGRIFWGGREIDPPSWQPFELKDGPSRCAIRKQIAVA